MKGVKAQIDTKTKGGDHKGTTVQVEGEILRGNETFGTCAMMGTKPVLKTETGFIALDLPEPTPKTSGEKK